MQRKYLIFIFETSIVDIWRLYYNLIIMTVHFRPIQPIVIIIGTADENERK